MQKVQSATKLKRKWISFLFLKPEEANELNPKHDSQRTYNVALWRFRVTIFVAEKQ